MIEDCPSCRTKLILDSGERVCSKCGFVKPTYEPYLGAEVFSRAPQSHCVYGGGLGTDIYSKQRGEGGSNAPSYDLHGGNGKYKPVVSVMQPWDLLNVVEPNSKIRTLREKISSRSLSKNAAEYTCPECEMTFGDTRSLLEHRVRTFQKTFGFDLAYSHVISSVNDVTIGIIVGPSCRCHPKTTRSRRIDEATLSNESRSIIGTAKKLIDAKKHLIADEYSREEMDINDPVIFGGTIKQNHRLQEMLEVVAVAAVKKKE